MYSCIWCCKCPNVMVWLAKSSTCVKEVTSSKSSEHLMSSEQASVHYFLFEMIVYSECAARKHGCWMIRSCTGLDANWTVRTISSSVCVLHAYMYIHMYKQACTYIHTWMWSMFAFSFLPNGNSSTCILPTVCTNHTTQVTHHILPCCEVPLCACTVCRYE